MSETGLKGLTQTKRERLGCTAKIKSAAKKENIDKKANTVLRIFGDAAKKNLAILEMGGF